MAQLLQQRKTPLLPPLLLLLAGLPLTIPYRAMFEGREELGAALPPPTPLGSFQNTPKVSIDMLVKPRPTQRLSLTRVVSQTMPTFHLEKCLNLKVEKCAHLADKDLLTPLVMLVLVKQGPLSEAPKSMKEVLTLRAVEAQGSLGCYVDCPGVWKDHNTATRVTHRILTTTIMIKTMLPPHMPCAVNNLLSTIYCYHCLSTTVDATT